MTNMSIEGGTEKYSPEEIVEFEKTRVQNADQAHEEANMMSVALERRYPPTEKPPTAEDYNKALSWLSELQHAVASETPATIKAERALTIFNEAFVFVAFKVPALLVGGALLDVLHYPENVKTEAGGGLVEQFKTLVKESKNLASTFQSAHDELEKWKKEAEEFAKKQTEA